MSRLFGTVAVPQAVYDEVCQPDKKQAHALKAFLHGKVHKVDLKNYVFLDAFADKGETEAMLLYKQLAANKLLIDDRRGRKVAKISSDATTSTNRKIRYLFKCGVDR